MGDSLPFEALLRLRQVGGAMTAELFCASDLRQLDATVGYRLDTEKKRFRRAGNMNLLSTRLCKT
jgi:hypothetical protein